MMNRKSLRLAEYDYSQAGRYFITICSHEKKCIFGKVKEGKMHKNRMGEIIESEWKNLPNFFNDISIGPFVVMPNHIHGIIEIVGVGLVPTQNKRATTRVAPTLGEVVGAFKSRVVYSCIDAVQSQKMKPFDKKIWQRNYYEHVIRNDESFEKIYEYILTNPLCWEKDRFFSFDDYEY